MASITGQGKRCDSIRVHDVVYRWYVPQSVNYKLGMLYQAVDGRDADEMLRRYSVRGKQPVHNSILP